jgi:hypothetical protein
MRLIDNKHAYIDSGAGLRNAALANRSGAT